MAGDWFSQNAPQGTASKDWFSDNAPNAISSSEDVPQPSGPGVIPSLVADAKYAAQKFKPENVLPAAWDTIKAGVKGALASTPPGMAYTGLRDLMSPEAPPTNPANQIAQASIDNAKKAREALTQGRTVEGLGYAAGTIPLIGPMATAIGEQLGGNPQMPPGQQSQLQGPIREPDPGSAMGTGLGMAAQAVAPAALQGALRLAGRAAGGTARTMYQSALKPSQADPAAAAQAVQTGLKQGIPISEAGQAKLTGLISNLSDRVKDIIASDPNATVDPQAVATRLNKTSDRFTNQVNPVADLNAIDASKSEFLGQQGAKPAVPPSPTGLLDPYGRPLMSQGAPAMPAPPIPAADAQAMKQGTYGVLKGKAFGELKSAQVEAEKGLARGIKEELETQFPEIGPTNAQQGQALNLDPYLEKAVARIGNHNVMSLGDTIAAGVGGALGHTLGLPPLESAVAAAVLRHVVGSPAFKSRLAIALNKGSIAAGNVSNLAGATARVNGYLGALAAQNSQPPSSQPTPPRDPNAPMQLTSPERIP